MKAILMVLISLIVIGSFLPYQEDKIPDMEWDMVNVNYSAQQGDAHLIRVKGGKTILIDAGHWNSAGDSLLTFLKSRSIKRIDTVFISHPHVDHYGGLMVLLDNDITFTEVYFNVPDREVCDREIPWGCNYKEVLEVRQRLRDRGVDVKTAVAGQRFALGAHTWVEILYGFDGVNTPVGRTDVNDLSLVMMLHHKEYKFLFTGDLNAKIGGYLSGLQDDLTADILKVPHHGTETTVPDSFFAKVSPEYAFVPSPAGLWESDRSARIRRWFVKHKIPVSVNGISGNVRAVVRGDRLMISAEHDEMGHRGPKTL